MTGCGEPSGPQRFAIQGSVRLDGQALPSGMIRFIPADGNHGTAAAAPIQNGHYEMSTADGPIEGTHRVEIEATDYLGFPVDDEAAFAAAANKRARLPKNPVPDTYNRQSTLVAEITATGTREFNFDLESRSKR
jgi:hypothetical protein